MTRIAGYRKIACPSCKAVYKTPNYSSINMTSFERWSDGREVHALFDNGGGIRSCKCGIYFQLKYAEDLGLMSVPKYVEVWEDTGEDVNFDLRAFRKRQAIDEVENIKLLPASSLFKKIKELLTSKLKFVLGGMEYSKKNQRNVPEFQNDFKNKEELVPTYDIPEFMKAPKEQIDLSSKRMKRLVLKNIPLERAECNHIPTASFAHDSEMRKIIKSPDIYTQEMILIARERLWPYLNDYYREPFRAYIKNRKLPVPKFDVSDEQFENLEALLLAEQAKQNPEWITIGEIHRELSRFDEASDYFLRVEITKHNEADLEKHIRASRMKISGPIPI